MRTQDLPVAELSRNMCLIGHCDQGGRPDGVQVMVHRGYAYVGDMFSKGFSVIDAKSPTQPRAAQCVRRITEARFRSRSVERGEVHSASRPSRTK
jgi:hypothetical protein